MVYNYEHVLSKLHTHISVSGQYLHRFRPEIPILTRLMSGLSLSISPIVQRTAQDFHSVNQSYDKRFNIHFCEIVNVFTSLIS